LAESFLALKKVGSLSRRLNITQKSSEQAGSTWNEWTETAYRGWLSSTNLGNGGIWEDQEEDGGTKNTLSFEEQLLRPKP
jgi:hypothetical protein